VYYFTTLPKVLVTSRLDLGNAASGVWLQQAIATEIAMDKSFT